MKWNGIKDLKKKKGKSIVVSKTFVFHHKLNSWYNLVRSNIS